MDIFQQRSRQLLDRIAGLIEDERRVAQEAISRLWSQPLEERIRLRRAIGKVRVEEVSVLGELTLSCPENDSLFREGDMVRLSLGDPWGQEAVTGSLEVDDDTVLVVRLEQLGDAERFRSNPEGWVLDEGYLDLHGMFEKALQEAADHIEKNLARMPYDQALERGLPIATGVIEGACRHLVKDRMELTGTRWRLDDAEAIPRPLALND